MATGALLLGEELARQPCTSEASPAQTASPLKEPFVGNVSKCVPLPPEHSGAVQRGQLQFDACFETGNVLTAPSAPPMPTDPIRHIRITKYLILPQAILDVWTGSVTMNMIYLLGLILAIQGTVNNYKTGHFCGVLKLLFDTIRFRVWFNFTVQNVQSEQVCIWQHSLFTVDPCGFESHLLFHK